MQAAENGGHSFTLINRGHAEITGVSDVDCFNEPVSYTHLTLPTTELV